MLTLAAAKARQHGLRALADCSRSTCVHVARRREVTLVRGVALLAEGLWRAGLADEARFVERQLGDRLLLGGRELADLVVEARHGAAAVGVVQAGEDRPSAFAGFFTAPPNSPECRSRVGPVTSIWV